jgi:Protein of unknown function (DUF3017)
MNVSWIPFSALGLGLLLVTLGQIQLGIFVCGAAAVAAGGLRWWLPAAQTKWLISRHASVDITASLVLGVALCILAVVLPQ